MISNNDDFKQEVINMDVFKGLKRQEYKTIACETKDFNKWLKENNIDCEVVEKKNCWISVINNVDPAKSFQKILEERLGIEIHSLSYLHGYLGTCTDMIEIWYRQKMK